MKLSIGILFLSYITGFILFSFTAFAGEVEIKRTPKSPVTTMKSKEIKSKLGKSQKATDGELPHVMASLIVGIDSAPGDWRNKKVLSEDKGYRWAN